MLLLPPFFEQTMIVQTEFDFTLPKGFIDQNGQIHQQGRMRLARAIDEMEAIEHPGVKAKHSYLPVLLLARVVVQLGTLEKVTPKVIANLFAVDMVYLQDLYLRVNGTDSVMVGAICPHCHNQFQLQVAPLG
jgi:hypothetical protein